MRKLFRLFPFSFSWRRTCYFRLAAPSSITLTTSNYTAHFVPVIPRPRRLCIQLTKVRIHSLFLSPQYRPIFCSFYFLSLFSTLLSHFYRFSLSLSPSISFSLSLSLLLPHLSFSFSIYLSSFSLSLSPSISGSLFDFSIIFLFYSLTFTLKLYLFFYSPFHVAVVLLEYYVNCDRVDKNYV